MPDVTAPTPEQLRYLRVLSEKYPTIAAASSEIINLEALLRLPKGTEHFMSDLHGENEAFITHSQQCVGCYPGESRYRVLGEQRARHRSVPSWPPLFTTPTQKLALNSKPTQTDLDGWYRQTSFVG